MCALWHSRLNLTTLHRRFQSDRLIRIIVGTGEDAQTFNIQQVILENVSEYFVKAMKNERLGSESESGVLRFPVDDICAWEALSYWLMKRDLPRKLVEGSDVQTAVCCWVLGDCYSIPRLQDEAMLALLWIFRNWWPEAAELAKAFKSTPPGSQLRRLMAEVIAEMLKKGAVNFTYAACDDLLNGTNFVEELLRARDVYDDEQMRKEVEERFSAWGPSEGYSTWRSYMVGKDLTGFAEQVASWKQSESN